MCIALARSRIDCIRSHWIRIAHGSHGSIVSNSNLLVQPMPSKIAMSRPPPAPNEPSSQSHNWDQPGSTPVNSPSNLRRVVPVPPIFHWVSTAKNPGREYRTELCVSTELSKSTLEAFY